MTYGDAEVGGIWSIWILYFRIGQNGCARFAHSRLYYFCIFRIFVC